MLFSTRNQTIGRRASLFVRDECTARLPQGSEAIAMLCSHAELSQDMLFSAADSRMNVETVLYWCDGLAIALAISGRTIGESAPRHGQTPSGAVYSFVCRLQRDPSRLIDKPGDDYAAVAPLFEASLEMASKHSPVNVASGNLSLERMYAALCVT
jgi:hypothetical protein